MNVTHKSNGARLLNFLLIVVLAAGFAAVPATGRAQQAAAHPANPGQQSGGQPGLSAQPGHVQAEQEEEHNLFRHTELVAAVSDIVFHDDKNATDPEKVELRNKHIEATARGFEWINSTIILLVIFIPLFKILPKVMRKRSQTLRQNLDDARKTTADANTRLSAVEAKLAKLDEEIAGIRARVEEESKQDEVRIKASIQEESARIVASAEQEIAAAAEQAQRGLRHFAADLAIENAARQLVLTPETDRALIAEFVSEAAGNGAAKGGRN
ncbi:MAG TPA: ATP synthase F0 subunit B [Terracidiphilus sp.]|nr:ATP synthase F0 subunit B [Terracidiphilus sp.]